MSYKPGGRPMSDRITAKQARGLLEEATPGPWAWWLDDGLVVLVGADDETIAYDLKAEDSGLAAAAPDLAEALAWLYGKPVTPSPDGDYFEVSDGAVWVEGGEVIVESPSSTLTLDEAVDFARALLAAAEKERP